MIRYFVPKIEVQEVDYCNYCWVQEDDKGQFFANHENAVEHLAAQQMKVLYDLLLNQGCTHKRKDTPEELPISYFMQRLISAPTSEVKAGIFSILDELFRHFLPIEIKKVEIE